MSETVHFQIPHDFPPQLVAEALNAYLVGHELHEVRERGEAGPWPKDQDKKDKYRWQLDRSNNFWVEVRKSSEEGKAPQTVMIRSRYADEETLMLLAQLFITRYISKKEGRPEPQRGWPS